MHFRKLTVSSLLIFSLTFSLSASYDLKDEEVTSKTATMTYDEFVEKVTSGIEQHLVRQVRDNEAIKEISPNFYPELISIYNIVTAKIIGELNQEQRVSIIESLPSLTEESCYLVAARALLFSRLDSSKLFGSGTLFTTGKPEENWHESFISHVFKTPLIDTIEIENLRFDCAVEGKGDKPILIATIVTATKFAAGYSPYANVQSTKAHLGTLLVQWQTNRPETASEMFKQAFGYWRELKFQGAKLDPRDVVFYLIFGECISQHQPYLGSSFGKARYYDDIFDLNDYVKNYEALEQAGFKKANTSFWSSLGQALGLY